MQQELSLENVGDGKLPLHFTRGVAEILANIDDVNTDAEAKRVLTLKVTVAPAQDRRTMAISVTSHTSLAPTKGGAALAYMGRRKSDGKLVCATNDPNQRTIFDDEEPPDIEPIPRDDKESTS